MLQKIFMRLQKSFSLVELMVVIAIIGILSAIAVPSYKSYIIKSQMTEAIVIMQNLNKVVLSEYQTRGTLPATISFGSTTITQGSYGAYSTKYVNSIRYGWCGSDLFNCVQVYNISIPNLVASNGTSLGSRTEICTHIYPSNDIFNLLCGVYSLSPEDGGGNNAAVPLQYLPAGCNNPNVRSSPSSSC